jgi:hypothetical protein
MRINMSSTNGVTFNAGKSEVINFVIGVSENKKFDVG